MIPALILTHRYCLILFLVRVTCTWGAAAWTWRHLDGWGPVLHPFPQDRRLDQWRNTITLHRSGAKTRIAKDLSAILKENPWNSVIRITRQGDTRRRLNLLYLLLLGIYLIFGGGGRPLSHAAWVTGHLDLTLNISLVHSFILSKKPVRATKESSSGLNNTEDTSVCCNNMEQLTDLHLFLSLWGSCEGDKCDKDEQILGAVQ